jgi:hypothetical protein
MTGPQEDRHMNVAGDRRAVGDSRRPSELNEFVADYASVAMASTKDLSRLAFAAEPALHYLAHMRHGRCDFYMDVLDRTGLRRGAEREALIMLGTELTFQTSQLDEILQGARTGELIRTVLHTPHGVLVCNSVVPGESLLGAGFKASAVNRVDRMVSHATSQLREQIGLSSRNPGGWETVGLPTPDLDGEPALLPRVTNLSGHESVGREVAVLHKDMRPTDLHLVAYCVRGRPVSVFDQLDHPGLRPFFRTISVESRRRFYYKFCETLSKRVPLLNRMLSAVADGLLARLVLDVEQGAVYYRRLSAQSCLVGVTMDQRRVSHCDQQMEMLARALGGTPLDFSEE